MTQEALQNGSHYVEPADVPLVDFRALTSPDTNRRRVAVALLDAAFREWGFVQLHNHGIGADKLHEAFQWAERFFMQPTATKELIAHPPSGDVDTNRGWARVGLGYTVHMEFDADKAAAIRQQNPDCKETLELGNPFDATLPPNPWLPEGTLPGFRGFLEGWWTDCAILAHDLYRCLGEALRISVMDQNDHDDYFNRIHSANDCHMTWNYYPAMSARALNVDGAKRLNAHTDFGSLTLVFQDAVGGLEVHDGHQFRPIMPVPGALIVNVGDMLEQLSNGRWRSSLHRVVAPAPLIHGLETKEEKMVVDRYSLVFFGVPNPNEVIAIAPGCETPGKWKPNMCGNWGTLTARQWIRKRLAMEF
ncbi:isopenicillin N synthase family dioxygenase [Aspergillus brunneoviolaceus CBS 621.78]|uniref:2OG-Fe(II) oxygenase superfamily protein n=1 Tax=Aspergillus brunneoviolaceus CBS 621.78 TaxID=1450534 RepID=A0ACD1FS11_9EURO|nr:2OG-Fe(II) oxygenase superfamily protein [Aspergillus brunneoviolaceus CBS 621.78]RAH39761.1 2OG-Fe(II) oxygenase superfamily protein [Aspergillus brunneoviolaceus CBS 621.78]